MLYDALFHSKTYINTGNYKSKHKKLNVSLRLSKQQETRKEWFMVAFIDSPASSYMFTKRLEVSSSLLLGRLFVFVLV